MPKTILTMEDLVKFCEEKHLFHFSSSESGYPLAVKIPATFEVDDDENSAHRGMMRLKYKLYHIGRNLNDSYVSEESAQESLPTIAHRPVLAYIHQLEDGNWDFYSHNMEIVENEQGQKEIHYLESQVGAFSGYPDEQPYIAFDEETGKDFVFAYAYIPREYTRAAEIIERKGGTKNSVELCIEEMSYDAKEKYLKLDKFYVDGSTLLGSDEDGNEIKEGMQGSRADIADFKAEPQTFEANEKLIKALETLNETLSHFDKQFLGKEVDEVKKTDLEPKQATIEDFDLTDGNDSGNDGGNDGAGGSTTGEEAQGEGGTSGETNEGGTNEGGTTGGQSESGTGNDSQQSEGGTTGGGTQEGGTSQTTGDGESTVHIDDDETDESKKIGYTINFNGMTKEFGLSVSDKMSAIYSLVYATYGEEDWWDVDLFEEDGYIQMYGWLTGSNYRQKFEFDGQNYTLVGDRIEVFVMYVTTEQKAELEAQKTEFEAVKDKLRKYEEEPEKMSILNSEDYSKVFSTKEFEELKEQTNHFDLSIDEVKAKADAILLDYAKHSNFSLEQSETSKASFVQIPIIKKKPNRYGTIFSGSDTQEEVK